MKSIFALACLCAFLPRAQAFTERRAWLYDLASLAAIPTTATERRYQATFRTGSYASALSPQASLLLDLRELEIGGTLSQRFFFANTGDGQQLKAALQSQRYTLSAEVARHYVSTDGFFGRLGVELLQFLPSRDRYLKLGLHCGIHAVEAQRWSLGINGRIFFAMPGDSNYLIVTGDVLRLLGQSWRVGGLFSWGYRLRPTPPTGPYEHMNFDFGPVAEWRAFGTFRLSFPLKLWLDKDLLPSGQTISPLELTPTALLSWTVGV